jgi:hypothetical protein
MLSPDRVPDHIRVRFEFEDWVDKQPRDKKYPWANRSDCACAQFIRNAYGSLPPSGPLTILERIKRFFSITPDPDFHPDAGLVWAQFNQVARVEPHTFGALSDRLRELA